MSIAGTIKSLATGLRGTATRIYDKVGAAASGVSSSIGGAASRAATSVRNTASRISERVRTSETLFGSFERSGLFRESVRKEFTPLTATSSFGRHLRASAKDIGLIAGGYGIYKGTQSMGEAIDTANERSGRGSAYGTIVKGAGMVTGGAMALVGGTRMVAQQARVLGNTFDTEKMKTLAALNKQELQRIESLSDATGLSAKEKVAFARGDKGVSTVVTERLKARAASARSEATMHPADSPMARELRSKAEFAEAHVGPTKGYTPGILRLKNEVPENLREINIGRKSLNTKQGFDHTMYDEYETKDGGKAKVMDRDVRKSLEPEIAAVDKELVETHARTSAKHTPKISKAEEAVAAAKASVPTPPAPPGPPILTAPPAAPIPPTIAAPTSPPAPSPTKPARSVKKSKRKPVGAPPKAPAPTAAPAPSAPAAPTVPPTIAAPPVSAHPRVLEAEAALAKVKGDLSSDLAMDTARARSKKDILTTTAPDRHFLFKKTSKPISGYDKFADFTEAIPKKALEMITPAVADAGLGVAAAPIAPFMLMKHGFAHSNYVGSAIFGMGMYAGAGSALVGGAMFDKQPRDRAALGGTAVFDPNAGGRPRKSGMDPSVSNTAGLVQSLHRIR